MVRIALLFFIVLFNLGFWYWTTTPYYAVLQIRDAIKEHNLAKFEEFVDIDSVAEKMIDGFLTPQVRERLSRGILGELLGSGIIALMKPTLVNVIKEEVTHFIENNEFQPTSALPTGQNSIWRRRGSLRDRCNIAAGDYEGRCNIAAGDAAYINVSFNSLLSEVSLKGLTRKLGFGKGTFRKVSYMRVQQSSATIGLDLYNQKYNTKMLLELKMVKQDGRWRLVEVSNFASFMYTIIANEEARRFRLN